MTKRTEQIYEYIRTYMLSTGFVPSHREIMDEMGLYSLSSINNHLKKLEDAGLLIRKSEASPVYKLAGFKYVEVINGKDQ